MHDLNDGVDDDLNSFHFKYRSTLEFYESLKDGLLNLYKIQKNKVTAKKRLNVSLGYLIESLGRYLYM